MSEPRPIHIQISEAITSRNFERGVAGQDPMEEMWITPLQHASICKEHPHLLTENDGNFMGVRLRIIGT